MGGLNHLIIMHTPMDNQPVQPGILREILVMCDKIGIYHMLKMEAPALKILTTDTEMEPFVRANEPFLGLIIPANFRYLLPGNAVAIWRTDNKLVIMGIKG